MLGRFLLILGSIWLGRISIQSARQFGKKRAIRCRRNGGGEDRISALPDDLLVRILLLVPTEDVVATMILSKRWRFVWTMVPQLEYNDIEYGTRKICLGGLLGFLFGKSERPQSIRRFLTESMRLHKAPVLETLSIELGPHFPVAVNVKMWIANAVDRRVRELGFALKWSGGPISLPKSLYMCETIEHLHLSDKVYVDVSSSPVCLPFLTSLELVSVIYKDEDSLVRLLSSCPILKSLHVMRRDKDNVTKFSVKVPSLETFMYNHVASFIEDVGESLVIDSASLKKFFISDGWTTSCSIENKPRLDNARIYIWFDPDEEFMRSLSSVVYLELELNVATVACLEAIIFSQLTECKIRPCELDWFEPLVLLLQNSPKLKVLVIDQVLFRNEDFPLSWNQPSSVPECLSTNLEVFEWAGYGGTTEQKDMVSYIFANSKCLKRVGISLSSTCKRKDRKKIMKELESMSRISTSSQLLFSTQLKFTCC
ncbi:unnamed protein product [Microthlaspi erraticum]|uniref:F-box domain-containing protein n=1 Tax=Microthlaspi erraticum TaxID=1685480 RepID=A0A6D2KLP0_9BRAS|nr:unnamed protein product [Microthlaspi erraticum]